MLVHIVTTFVSMVLLSFASAMALKKSSQLEYQSDQFQKMSNSRKKAEKYPKEAQGILEQADSNFDKIAERDRAINQTITNKIELPIEVKHNDAKLHAREARLEARMHLEKEHDMINDTNHRGGARFVDFDAAWLEDAKDRFTYGSTEFANLSDVRTSMGWGNHGFDGVPALKASTFQIGRTGNTSMRYVQNAVNKIENKILNKLDIDISQNNLSYLSLMSRMDSDISNNYARFQEAEDALDTHTNMARNIIQNYQTEASNRMTSKFQTLQTEMDASFREIRSWYKEQLHGNKHCGPRSVPGPLRDSADPDPLCVTGHVQSVQAELNDNYQSYIDSLKNQMDVISLNLDNDIGRLQGLLSTKANDLNGKLESYQTTYNDAISDTLVDASMLNALNQKNEELKAMIDSNSTSIVTTNGLFQAFASANYQEAKDTTETDDTAQTDDTTETNDTAQTMNTIRYPITEAVLNSAQTLEYHAREFKNTENVTFREIDQKISELEGNISQANSFEYLDNDNGIVLGVNDMISWGSQYEIKKEAGDVLFENKTNFNTANIKVGDMPINESSSNPGNCGNSVTCHAASLTAQKSGYLTKDQANNYDGEINKTYSPLVHTHKNENGTQDIYASSLTELENAYNNALTVERTLEPNQKLSNSNLKIQDGDPKYSGPINWSTSTANDTLMSALGGSRLQPGFFQLSSPQLAAIQGKLNLSKVDTTNVSLTGNDVNAASLNLALNLGSGKIPLSAIGSKTSTNQLLTVNSSKVQGPLEIPTTVSTSTTGDVSVGVTDLNANVTLNVTESLTTSSDQPRYAISGSNLINTINNSTIPIPTQLSIGGRINCGTSGVTRYGIRIRKQASGCPQNSVCINGVEITPSHKPTNIPNNTLPTTCNMQTSVNPPSNPPLPPSNPPPPPPSNPPAIIDTGGYSGE